jgi:hypothetical protein
MNRKLVIKVIVPVALLMGIMLYETREFSLKTQVMAVGLAVSAFGLILFDVTRAPDLYAKMPRGDAAFILLEAWRRRRQGIARRSDLSEFENRPLQPSSVVGAVASESKCPGCGVRLPRIAILCPGCGGLVHPIWIALVFAILAVVLGIYFWHGLRR